MNSNKFLSIVIAFLVFAGNIIAQDIISAKDFMALQKENKDLVVIDASKSKLYDQAHIKGAINIPYAKLNDKEHAVNGMLLPVDKVAEVLGAKGVSHTDAIVVYDEGSQKYSTRVYWILKYLGAENVKLLHKNMSEFRKARVMLTSAVPSASAKTFTPTLNTDIIADAAYVESILGDPNVVIIDARTPEEFTGTGTGKNEYSKGHIEGSVSIPYESMIEGEDKVFITPEAFKALAPEVDFAPEKTYVALCKTGVKGAAMYAYLKEVMGLPNVKLYEGSYLDWEAAGKAVVK